MLMPMIEKVDTLLAIKETMARIKQPMELFSEKYDEFPAKPTSMTRKKQNNSQVVFRTSKQVATELG